jgi:hypothetical protein
MRRTVMRSGGAAVLASLLAASAAFAAEPQPVEVPPEVLAVAPPGSCAADPTQDRCPPVTKIVNVQVAAEDGSTAYAPESDAAVASSSRRHRARRRPRARASQAVGFACAVNSYFPVLLRHADGDAFIRARGANECQDGVGVTYQELYVGLQRWVDDAWQQLATNRAVKYGSGYISEIAGFNCHHTRVIAYRSSAFGYAVVKGVGYSATDYSYENHTCWP